MRRRLRYATPDMRHLALLLVAFTACGGPTSEEQVEKPVAPVAETVEGAGPASDAGSEPSVLGERQCQALFEHVFAIAFASKVQVLPEDQRPNEADLAVAKDRLRADIFSKCLTSTPEDFHYDCAMAARDRASMEACMSGEPAALGVK